MTPDLDALLAPLLDSAYRTALCLADGPAEAEALLAQAAARGLLEQSRHQQDLRRRILRGMTEIFRRRQAPVAREASGPMGPALPAEADRVVRAIRALTPSRRMVAALYFCEGLNCGEIAGVLACSRPAVRRRLPAVRAALGAVALARGSARDAGPTATYRPVPAAGSAPSGAPTSRATT